MSQLIFMAIFIYFYFVYYLEWAGGGAEVEGEVDSPLSMGLNEGLHLSTLRSWTELPRRPHDYL